MSIVSVSVALHDVDRIERRGIGVVFRGIITIGALYEYLRRGIVRYSPRYQRGFRTTEDLPESEFDKLFLINDERLQIDPMRARAIAVKYLKGWLFTSHVTWNVRVPDGYDGHAYDSKKRTANLEGDLTVPDTGHRHLAYFMLVLWHEHPEEIPEKVNVDGTIVTEDEILEMLKDFDPKHEQVFVEAFALPAREEGRLYDEFNSDGKAPSNAVAMDLNPDKTPSRRFVSRLMDKSDVLSRSEVETRRNTIGNVSRKLITTPTMEAAMRPLNDKLAKLENAKDGRYNDLVDFYSEFFKEWSHYFKPWQPKTKAEDRHKLREKSFALSNIMIHPLFRLAYDLWADYDSRKVDWHADNLWKQAVNKLAGKTTAEDGKVYPVMARANPDWQSRIMVKSLQSDGTTTWTLSSTRQTRESAYLYLLDIAELAHLSATKSTKRSKISTPTG
ncbi:hypothetical protein ADK67_30935 [Saccharothrix sp. NRRL B-16348]|uniref:DNA sulfur modification protein DndB n=1 Tax=Saccharothrix sp. NRRL B-16348 TaxID=1415542 RepID=UPI0006AFF28C|nr:DNA sulfur modification protein DndB [Saccharothrix sp. NRRL B-16348]KOX20257.1 hypothetical protein ADK67_30935 [Saccharothrix sp. NRRL B-16348]